MLNIIIPMAGAGSRFQQAGYSLPKPLIPVAGTPMIKIVINNLKPTIAHKFIFICQKWQVAEYDLRRKLGDWAPDSVIVTVDGLTEGAACTVLAAENLIDNDDPLMIANSDQFIDINIDDYLSALNENDLDGLIMTMKASDPKWSFVGVKDHLVTTVVEKQVISDEATVGIYNFRRGCDFVRAAKEMIRKELRVNNEFYVAPAYNELLATGSRVGIYNIGCEADGMYGLGTPKDLELFLSLPICHNAIKSK